MAIQAEGLLVQVQASKAEVLIMDWHLPGASMPDLLSDLCGLESPPKVVVLSVNPEVKTVTYSAGPDAFIVKNAPPDDLLDAVRSMKETVNSSR